TLVVAEALHRDGPARVDEPDDRPEVLAVRSDRALVGLRGRGVAPPEARPPPDRLLDLPLDEPVEAASILFERSPPSVSGMVPGSVAGGSARAGTHANRRTNPQARTMVNPRAGQSPVPPGIGLQVGSESGLRLSIPRRNPTRRASRTHPILRPQAN